MMMETMIRLIAIDLDGTLMDSENRIDEETIVVIQKVLDRGITVVPATGRCLGVFPKELSTLTGLRYAVTENGALIWNYRQEQEWRRFCLPSGRASGILELVRGEQAYAEVFIHGQAYADIRSLAGLEETGLGTNFIRYFTENHNFLRHLEQETQLLEEAEKVNLYFPDSRDAKRIRQRLEADSSIGIASSIGGNVEITAAGVDKGASLTKLSELLGIKKEEILVFGDNENDLGMFAAADTAVAMGNADEAIRQSADRVTGTNDEQGVAAVLRELFLL